ncbi:MAG: hypothetical protein O7C69_00625 [Gammaproteobacteria bacterium]|nr:hypothetical protein [Gammaproteobacteria bacterium]
MRQAPLFIWLGVTLHVVFFVLMLMGVEPFQTFFYLFAWWTFIPVIGVINARRGGNSLIVGTSQQLAWVTGFSLIVWLFFEIWNFWLHNWLYVGVIELTWLRWLAYAVSFATVLPAILEVDTLLGNLGLVRRVSGPVIRVSPRLLNGCVIAGLLMLTLVVLLPQYFFPLLWVGIVFILDPLVYRLDRVASLLGQAARGSYARMLRLMLAGLLCGVLWEFWNYWSGAKWVYAIPLFDFWKVFEMPLAGFLGFMPFALECYLFWQLLRLARETHAAADWRILSIIAALAAIYCALVFSGIDNITVIRT